MLYSLGLSKGQQSYSLLSKSCQQHVRPTQQTDTWEQHNISDQWEEVMTYNEVVTPHTKTETRGLLCLEIINEHIIQADVDVAVTNII